MCKNYYPLKRKSNTDETFASLTNLMNSSNFKTKIEKYGSVSPGNGLELLVDVQEEEK